MIKISDLNEETNTDVFLLDSVIQLPKLLHILGLPSSDGANLDAMSECQIAEKGHYRASKSLCNEGNKTQE